MLHPMRVASALGYDDIELACIGLLHDVLEDGFIDGVRVTADYLREQLLTERIISGVECLTKLEGEAPRVYEAKVISNYDSVRAKIKDIEDNLDLCRLYILFDGDLKRAAAYHSRRSRLLQVQRVFEVSPEELVKYLPTVFDDEKA